MTVNTLYFLPYLYRILLLVRFQITSNQIKIKDLEHTNATAKGNAELDSANSLIKYLEDALETANKALDAERAARIEIASKTAQPTINVNGKM